MYAFYFHDVRLAVRAAQLRIFRVANISRVNGISSCVGALNLNFNVSKVIKIV